MMKSLKGVAVAAMLAVSSFGTANAATFSDLGLSYVGDYTFKSTVATAATFWSTIQSLATTETYADISGYFASKLNPGETIDGTNDVGRFGSRITSPWFAQITFNSSTKTISFLGADINSSVTETSGSTVPVPGPEAGAGIGALAMAGMAYVAMRRRKQPLAA